MGRTLGVLLMVFLLAGCAAIHPIASTSPGATTIPWLPLVASSPPPPPTPQPIAVPPGTPACAASQLIGAVLGSNGATGHIITSFAFATTAGPACFLDGMPSVTLLDAAGHTIGFRTRAAYAPSTAPGPALVKPGPLPQPYSGQQPGRAYLAIDWDSQPEPCPGESAVVVAQARIGVPAGGELSIAVPTEPGAYVCQGLGVGKFSGAAVPVAPGPTPPPMPAVSLHGPATAHAGKPYRYQVTLHNEATQPIDLAADCPDYLETLTVGSAPVIGKELYGLNCAPAGTIAPGSSVTFEIVLNVFASAEPGVYALGFTLMRWDSLPQKDGASAQVTVVS